MHHRSIFYPPALLCLVLSLTACNTPSPTLPEQTPEPEVTFPVPVK